MKKKLLPSNKQSYFKAPSLKSKSHFSTEFQKIVHVQLITHVSLTEEEHAETNSSLFELVDSDGQQTREDGLHLILHHGGTICDDRFDDNSAAAICREMNFTGSRNWSSGSRWDIQSSYDITLDEVECPTEEWDSCSFMTSHDCSHSEDVFLSCDSGKQ